MPEWAQDHAMDGAGHRRRVRRHARLGRILLDRDLADDDADDLLVSDTGSKMVAAANRARALSVFGEYVATGRPVDEAAIATVRVLTAARLRPTARAFLFGFEPAHGERLTSVGLGQVLFSMAEYDHAWEYFKDAPVGDLARLVPLEAATCALKAQTPESLAMAEEIGRRAPTYDVSTLVDLAGQFLVTGYRSLARDLLTEARRRDLAAADDFHRDALDNLLRWTEPVPTATPTGAVTVGVLDYHLPDHERASRNVGDYIQTLAMLGNLARFRETRFAGADGLGELMAELQERVKPELQLEEGAAEVTLLPISRDLSDGDQIPEQTWMLAFGWHMHSTFRLGFGLPYHRHLNPIFLSFHINRVGVLTPEVIDYLRAHGPIGCRDRTTVDLPLSAGVDAFFTGCVTSTVDAVFRPTADVERDDPGVVAAIDLPDWMVRRIRRPTEIVTHGGVEHRLGDLTTGVRAASELLDNYQRRYARVVTSRLHSYLPATSLGLDVRFRPAIEGDVRFDGLRGMKPDNAPFTSMRDGIRALIADTFELILQGADRDAVYTHREMTAAHVTTAKERLLAPPKVEALPFDLVAMVREVGFGYAAVRAPRRGRPSRHGRGDELGPEPRRDPPGDRRVAVDQRLRPGPPLGDSAWPGRDVPAMVQRSVPPAAGHLPGLRPRGVRRHHAVDRPHDGRDHGPLAAARDSHRAGPDHLHRHRHLHRGRRVRAGDDGPAGARPRRPRCAVLRRTAVAGGRGPAPCGPGVRPAPDDGGQAPFRLHGVQRRRPRSGSRRLRADQFTTEFVPVMAGGFGLNDQDSLNAYAGRSRAELPTHWNALPLLERVTEPGIVHFAGAGKPWGAELVPEGHRWHRYARQFADRAAPAPARGEG